MVSVTIPRVVAAGAVIGAVLLVQFARAPSDGPSSALFEVAPLPAREAPPVALAAAEPAPAANEPPAAAKQRELEAMSETFRNSTFLIAIRDAGFGCDQLLRVVGGFDGSTKWMATCSEMLSYTVAVANDGTLQVARMAQYFDGLSPLPIESNGELVLPQSLPPRSVPPPR